jgi:hypothetical protein
VLAEDLRHLLRGDQSQADEDLSQRLARALLDRARTGQVLFANAVVAVGEVRPASAQTPVRRGELAGAASAVMSSASERSAFAGAGGGR